jgi:excisionase family DNA binding protein
LIEGPNHPLSRIIQLITMSINKILSEIVEIKQLLALNKKVWTMEDFCKFTGISKPYAYHLTSTGKIRCYRPFGKIIFFDPEEVIEFLKQNPVKGKIQISDKVNHYFLTAKS